MSGKRRYSLTKDSTKKCTACGQFKNVAEFGWSNKKRGWKAGECRACARLRVEDYYKRRKKPIIKYLKSHPCVDCGYDDFRALDFDHVRGEKSFTMSSAWRRTDKEVEDEIAKCEVRCRNCHAIRHCEEGYRGGRPIANEDAIEFYEIEEDERPPNPQLSLFDFT